MRSATPAPVGGSHFAPAGDLGSQGCLLGLSAERRERVEQTAVGGVVTFALGLQPGEKRPPPPGGFDAGHHCRNRIVRGIVEKIVGNAVTRMRLPVDARGGPFDAFDFGGVPLAGGEKCRLEIAHLGGQRSGKGRHTVSVLREIACLRGFHRIAQCNVGRSAGAVIGGFDHALLE